MSTTKQCLACIRTCHRIAREGEGYVATSLRYGLDLKALQMELVNIRRAREHGYESLYSFAIAASAPSLPPMPKGSHDRDRRRGQLLGRSTGGLSPIGRHPEGYC